MYREIRNIRYGPIVGDDEHGTIEFEYKGETVRIEEPSTVILSDNDASRKWITDRYWFLLGAIS